MTFYQTRKFAKWNKHKERASREMQFYGIESRKNVMNDLTIKKLYQRAHLSIV